MWLKYLLVGFYLIGNCCCIHKFYYWDIKPYIYTEDDGKVTGIVVDYYIEMKNINKNCPFKTVSHYDFLGEIFEFERIADNQKEFERKFINFTKNSSSNNTTVWFPILGSKHIPKSQLVVTYNLASEEGLVIVCLESSLDTLSKYLRMSATMLDMDAAWILAMLGFALLTRLMDFNTNPDYGNTFTRSFGTAIWLSTITMGAIGYGDVTPKHALARTVTVVMMLCGLFMTSAYYAISYTAFRSNTFTNTGESFAILKDSFEEVAVNEAFKHNMKGYDSYEEVLEAVRKREVMKAILPQEIAAYMQDHWNVDSTREASLAVSNVMEGFEIPLQSVVHGDTAFNACGDCENIYSERAMQYALGKHRKIIKPYRQNNEDFMAFLLERRYLQYAYVTILTLILLGVCFDIGQWIRRMNEDVYSSSVRSIEAATVVTSESKMEMDREEFISLKIELRLIDTMLQEILQNHGNVEEITSNDHIYCTPFGRDTMNTHLMTRADYEANYSSVSGKRNIKRVKSVPRYTNGNSRVRRPLNRTGSFPRTVNNQLRNSGRGYGRMSDQPIYERPVYVKRNNNTSNSVAPVSRSRRSTPNLKRGKTFVHNSNGHTTVKRKVVSLKRGESFPSRISTNDSLYDNNKHGKSAPKRGHYEQVKQRPSIQNIAFKNHTKGQIGQLSIERPDDKTTLKPSVNDHLVITEC